ncbi:hypothetical protein MASR2M78_29560 [Treponema sp.]
MRALGSVLAAWADDPAGSPQRFDSSAPHILSSIDATLKAAGKVSSNIAAEAIVIAWLPVPKPWI